MISLVIICIDNKGQNGTIIFNILDNTTELWMTKYIICEILSSGRATFYKNPSDPSVYNRQYICIYIKLLIGLFSAYQYGCIGNGWFCGPLHFCSNHKCLQHGFGLSPSDSVLIFDFGTVDSFGLLFGHRSTFLA